VALGGPVLVGLVGRFLSENARKFWDCSVRPVLIGCCTGLACLSPQQRTQQISWLGVTCCDFAFLSLTLFHTRETSESNEQIEPNETENKRDLTTVI